jgi:DNA-binding IclR family transcriptional regulator
MQQGAGRATEQVGGQTAATVERAADVLVLFTENERRTLGVTEIAAALRLSKPAVHRILGSLRSRGLVDLDETTHRYSLGLTAMRLGLAYLDRLDVRRLAGPELAALSRGTGETATLSIRTGDHRVYVDQVTPPREVIMAITLGVPYPLHAGASAKALLAFLGDAELGAYLADAPVADPGALRRELGRIRARGYARSFAERQPGAGSVAAPILDHHGRPVAAISVCGPLERFETEAGACAAALLETTGRLSARMGHQSPNPERG